MRWKQVYNPETDKNELVPVDIAARRAAGHFIHDDFEPFVSPIDNTVVSGRKQYDDHCRKHGVVNAAEFPVEHYEKAAQQRADHYQARSSRAVTQARRENINEVINHLTRAKNG